MAWTSTDLDSIDAAIATGQRVVKFSDGKEVEYRSIMELTKARQMISASLTTASGISSIRQVRIFSTKGL